MNTVLIQILNYFFLILAAVLASQQAAAVTVINPYPTK